MNDPTRPPAASPSFAQLERLLAVVLIEAEDDPLRFPRLQALGEQVLAVVPEDTDEALFSLFQRATRLSERYSVAHALACALVGDLAAQQLGWPVEERRVLAASALSMNVGMTALQNELAHRDRALTPEQREAVQTHAARSAGVLRAGGVTAALWLAVVERHHVSGGWALPLASLEPADRLAHLLQRVDVFLAKLSPRAGRKGLLSPAAAREACVGPDGRPDPVGAAIMRVVGFYPPGTWVRLANGEFGVALERGARADQPLVAGVADERRQPLAVPRLRRTDEPEHRVQGACRTDEVRLPYGQELLWSLRRG